MAMTPNSETSAKHTFFSGPEHSGDMKTQSETNIETLTRKAGGLVNSKSDSDTEAAFFAEREFCGGVVKQWKQRMFLMAWETKKGEKQLGTFLSFFRCEQSEKLFLPF